MLPSLRKPADPQAGWVAAAAKCALGIPKIHLTLMLAYLLHKTIIILTLIVFCNPQMVNKLKMLAGEQTAEQQTI
jgi:hypothetical protein